MNMRTLYIFEGAETICVAKGESLQRYETHNGIYYRGEVKHKGIFGTKSYIKNIRDIYFGQPKKLFMKNKIVDGWQVVKVGMDYMTAEPFIPDIPPALAAKLHTLENEVNVWKKKYYDAVNATLTLEGKDRFEEEMKRRMKVAGEIRSLSYGSSGMGGFESPFASRWGLGGAPYIPPSSGTNE